MVRAEVLEIHSEELVRVLGVESERAVMELEVEVVRVREEVALVAAMGQEEPAQRVVQGASWHLLIQVDRLGLTQLIRSSQWSIGLYFAPLCA